MSETGGMKSQGRAASVRVLVTGATGKQGSRVARQLLQRGHPVRAVARRADDPRLDSLRSQGAEIVAGDFDHPETLERAGRGVAAVFLMGTPFGGGAEVEARQGSGAVDAFARAKVPWLVYSSVSDADRQTGIPHFESKFRVEQHLRSSGIPWAVVGPTAFMENFLLPFQLPSLRQGRLMGGTSGDRPVQMVALDDLAGFTVEVLENPEVFQGRRVNVASDTVSQASAARTIASLSGRPIEYQRTPIDALRAQNPDTASMLEWFERAGYTADIEALRREHPTVGWQRFDQWAARQDFRRLLAVP